MFYIFMQDSELAIHTHLTINSLLLPYVMSMSCSMSKSGLLYQGMGYMKMTSLNFTN